MKTLSELVAKAVSEVKFNVKNLIEKRKKGKFYKELPEDTELDIVTLRKAVNLKNEIDILESQLKALQEQYKPLRDEILESLPGDEKDKVEVIIDGIQIKKYAQVRNAGKLDHEKALELARKKKILQKVTKVTRVIDEDLLLLAISEGKITYDEFAECLTEGNVIQQLKLEQKNVKRAVGDNIVQIEF